MAFAWDSTEPELSMQAQAAERRLLESPGPWTCVMVTPGLTVFIANENATSCSAVRLSGVSGVVVGVLFRRLDDRAPEAGSAVAGIDAPESRRIIASGGRRLISGYWGRYVAFLVDTEGGKRWVVRDPSGHLPCFRVQEEGLQIYFSYMGDCVAAARTRFSVNWDYVAVRVMAPGLQCVETGIQEVTELQAGECVESAGARTSRKCYWNPIEVAGTPGIQDVREACRKLRETAKACVRTWASCYSGILLRLSGGLDSSIVLGCLRATPLERLTCVTYYSSSAEGASDLDERCFARLAASGIGVPLLEIARNPAAPLQSMLAMGCFSTPSPFVDRNVEIDVIERRLATEYAAQARFGGDGGDQLFYQNPILPVVGDYLGHFGFTRRLLSLALGVARSQGLSVWQVVRRAAYQALLGERWTPYGPTTSYGEFVKPSVRESFRGQSRYLHPCLREVGREVPHGKLWHVYMLSVPPRFYSNLAEPGDPEWTEPLTSQPLLELCLQIPTFILAEGGRDRSLARRAFSDEVPAQILQRRSKGALEVFLTKAIAHNIAFVRQMMLDGELVKNGLLERSVLEKALGPRPEKITSSMSEIFDYLALEIWLRGWLTRSQGPWRPLSGHSDA